MAVSASEFFAIRYLMVDTVDQEVFQCTPIIRIKLQTLFV